MKKEEKGISRRRFLTGSAAIALSGLLTKKVFSQAKDSPPLKTGTRLILLGTGGGPRPIRCEPNPPGLFWLMRFPMWWTVEKG